MVLTQAVPRAAEAYAREQRAIVKAATLAVLQKWSQVSPADLDASYRAVEPSLTAIASVAQRRIAVGAQEYIPAVLAETGQDAAEFARVRPAALVGVAGDGRPVDSLLYGAVTHAKSRIAGGPAFDKSGRVSGYREPVSPAMALQSARSWLSTTTGTLLSDTGRASEQLAMGVRPVTGYVRMLNPPSCSRCAILAGRFYRKNTGFPRHPKCFPAGVVVSGPQSEAASRRWYQGELVVFATASGQELSLTGNHPVLTGRGWVPANLLKEGDEVVRSTRPEGATPLVVPDHHQVPARIEDVWGALSVAGFDSVESSPEDFHGDGQYGQVDVVWANRPLDSGVYATLKQHAAEFNFSVASLDSGLLSQQGGAALLDLGVLAAAGGLVGGGSLSLALEGAHLGHANEAGFAGSAALYAGGREPFGDDSAGYPVLAREGVFAGARKVGGHDLFGRDVADLPRWDAPGDSFSVETAEGYTARGRDLLDLLSGQVELDRVVELRRVEWSGHVYSLTSAEGWHVANSLIVSNCDCRHIPSTESMAGDLTVDPRRYFESLSRVEQDRLFTRSGAEAIREGADPSQVVNARRGMTTSGQTSTTSRSMWVRKPDGSVVWEERVVNVTRRSAQATQIGGRDALLTSEGTTRRRRAAAITTRGPRLMPETIGQIATDRADYLRLLGANGYLA